MSIKDKQIMLYLLLNKDTLKYFTFKTEEELISSSEDDVYKNGGISCITVDDSCFKTEQDLIYYITTLIIRAGNKAKIDRVRKDDPDYKVRKYICMKCNKFTTTPLFMYDESYAYCKKCSPYELNPEGIIDFFRKVMFPQKER